MRWFISIRYFLSHKRQSAVCIAGVTISVVMFIAMVAMMNGFEDKFIIETVESSGHITIKDEPRETQTPILERVYRDPNALLSLQRIKPRAEVRKIKNPTGLLGALARMPGIEAAAPTVQGDVIGTFGTKTQNIAIIGIDPEQEVRVTTIASDMLQGGFPRLKTTADGIVLGKGLADVLGVKLDDSVALSSPEGGRTTARVVGIFSTGVTPIDYSRGYMLLPDAQTLLNKKNIINEIVIRTVDYTQAPAFAAQIESISGYRTEPWQESNANFLKIFKIQHLITYIITGALLIVAAFGVLNILIMSVLERVNDIAILKSVGYSRGDITLIYFFQGLVIGLIGSTLGLIFGKLAIEGLRRIPITIEGIVRSEGLLMSEHPAQYYQAFFSSIVIVMIAAVYPARRAAKYDPVEVIRGARIDLPRDMGVSPMPKRRGLTTIGEQELLKESAVRTGGTPVSPPLLLAQNVHRVLGSGENLNHILKGVNLSIARNEYVSIVGVSGSGKSTLLYLLGGLDRPTRKMDDRPIEPPSAIFIDGHDTAGLNDVQLAMLRNEKLGFVFQFHYLLKEFTAQENVCLPMFKLGKLSRSQAMDRAAELLKQFGLGDKIRRSANRLSGGEQQRVAIARALANEPAAILADEPTGNLDKRNSERVADLFHEISQRGQTIVMVTHDAAIAARARRMVTMEDGNVIKDIAAA